LRAGFRGHVGFLYAVAFSAASLDAFRSSQLPQPREDIQLILSGLWKMRCSSDRCAGTASRLFCL
jgi:hypothetical protein